MQKLRNLSIVYRKNQEPIQRDQIYMNIIFQLLLHIMKVKSQEDL